MTKFYFLSNKKVKEYKKKFNLDIFDNISNRHDYNEVVSFLKDNTSLVYIDSKETLLDLVKKGVVLETNNTINNITYVFNQNTAKYFDDFYYCY
jgi:hypothetical protein